MYENQYIVPKTFFKRFFKLTFENPLLHACFVFPHCKSRKNKCNTLEPNNVYVYYFKTCFLTQHYCTQNVL